MQDSITPVTITQHRLFYDEPLSIDSKFLESVRLFDGFFLGNIHAIREEQFLLNNKIGLIIGCEYIVSPPLPMLHYNFYNKRGELHENFNINSLESIFRKMEECLNGSHEAVLIVSKQVDNKSITLAALFMMVRYQWDKQTVLEYIRSKRADLSLIDKYQQLLKKFSKHSHRNKLNNIFDRATVNQQEMILRNTFRNSVRYQLPDFYGLCHRKQTSNQETQSNTRTVMFKESIQYIDNKNQEYLLSIDLDATPLSPSQNIDMPLKPNHELTTVEKRLRNYIREKYHNNSDSLTLKEKPDIVQFTSKEVIKKLPRRRAVSKTEESVQFDPFVPQKDNYTQQRFTLQQTKGSRKGSSQQNTMKSSQKDKVIVLNRAKLMQRSHTETTQHELTHQMTKSNNLFKISKNNKNSSRKIRTNLHRFKTHSYKQKQPKDGQKHYQVFDEEISLNMREPRVKESAKIMNLNLHIQIDNFKVVQGSRIKQAGRMNSSEMIQRHKGKSKQ